LFLLQENWRQFVLLISRGRLAFNNNVDGDCLWRRRIIGAATTFAGKKEASVFSICWREFGGIIHAFDAGISL
jgi:hypothetical protein